MLIGGVEMPKRGKRGNLRSHSKTGHKVKKEQGKSAAKTTRRKKPKVTRDTARKYLRNVSPEKSFWIMEGPIIKNLSELVRELKIMSNHTFIYHVNRKKNDFAKWIQEVIEDKTLARDIKKAYSKTQLLKKVQSRVKMMRKVLS